MAIITNRELRAYQAVMGWQEPIVGSNVSQTGTLARGDLSSSLTVNRLAGATLAAGTYYYALSVAGCSALDVTLRMSAHTGTVPTITLFPTLADNVSIKGSATSVTALVDATQATTSVTTLRGEEVWVLKIVVPASATTTFDQAEYSAL